MRRLTAGIAAPGPENLTLDGSLLRIKIACPCTVVKVAFMLFWIILAVALILYGLVAYMSSRNWQVGHVVLLFFVSLFAIGGIILAAMNLRTQAAWREVHDQLAEQVTALETQLDQLERGAVLSSDPDAVDIPTLKEEVTRALIQRGRVWRGVSPVGADEDAITLSMQGWGDSACARVGIEPDRRG